MQMTKDITTHIFENEQAGKKLLLEGTITNGCFFL